MKKIQCEVCGSVDIRKVSDGVFACQHCGVQYRTEDMSKLLVEIKDILENIEEKVSQENEPEKKPAKTDSVWENCYIVEAKVEPQENVKHFLRYLDKAENIAGDIYKEMKVESTKEFYLPFFYAQGRYRIAWNATICHKYYENETVYKESYDSKLGKWVKEPRTEKVERVQRTPGNGTQDCNCSAFSPASHVLKKELSALSEEENRKLFEEFCDNIEKKINDGEKILPFDTSKLRQEGNTFYYGAWQVLNEMEQERANEVKSRLQYSACRIVKRHSEQELNGGYFENYTDSGTTLAERLSFVYVPVQVITYCYKGEKYMAVSDLASTTRTIPAIYPCDQDLVREKVEMAEKTEQANKRSLITNIGLISGVLGMVVLVFMAVMDTQEDAAITALMVLLCISLVLIVVGLIVDARKRNQNEKDQAAMREDVYLPRELALEKGKEAILAAYPGSAVIDVPTPEAGKIARELCYCEDTDSYRENR